MKSISEIVFDLTVNLTKIGDRARKVAIIAASLYLLQVLLVFALLKLPANECAFITMACFQFALIFYGIGFVARLFSRADKKSDAGIEINVLMFQHMQKMVVDSAALMERGHKIMASIDELIKALPPDDAKRIMLAIESMPKKIDEFIQSRI